MERREFLIRAGQTVIAVPLVLTAVSCGSDDNSPTAPNANDAFDVISSPSNNHTHLATFTCADLASGGIITTGFGNNHTHQIELDAGVAQRIMAGETVIVSHQPDATLDTHTWSVTKPSNACT